MKKYILLSLFLLLVGSSTASASDEEVRERKARKREARKREARKREARKKIVAAVPIVTLVIVTVIGVATGVVPIAAAVMGIVGSIGVTAIAIGVISIGRMEGGRKMRVIALVTVLVGVGAIVAIKLGIVPEATGIGIMAIALEARTKKIYKGLASFLAIGGLVTLIYFFSYRCWDHYNEVYAQKKVIKHSPDVGQDKKVVPSISSSIGIYPLLFTLIVLGGLYLFLYRDFYFSALPQPAAADDADSAEGDVLSGEEGEATPSGTEAGKYPILFGSLGADRVSSTLYLYKL